MPPFRSATVRIGGMTVTTHVDTARKIAADPALLLRCYDMMLEAAQKLNPYRSSPPDPWQNRLHRRRVSDD